MQKLAFQVLKWASNAQKCAKILLNHDYLILSFLQNGNFEMLSSPTSFNRWC